MNKIWTVAIREFQKTVFTKAFILGTFVFPVLVWTAFPIVMSLTRDAVPPLGGTLAVIVDSEEFAVNLRREFAPDEAAESADAERKKEALEKVFEDPKSALADEKVMKQLAEEERIPVNVKLAFHNSNADVNSLREQVASGDLIGLVIVPSEILSPDQNEDSDSVVKIIFSDDIKHQHTRLLKDRISEAVIEVRVIAQGGEVESLRSLMRRPPFVTAGVDVSGMEKEDTTGIQRVLPIFFMVLLWLATMTSGQYILSSTVEEKSTKVIEVLLSAVSPFQLMTGRILGEFFVGCIVLVMYGGAGVAALVAFATLDLINPVHLIYFALYFVIAYLVLACVMASVGSAVNDMVEAQTLMMPIMFIFMLGPMLVMMPALQNPNGIVANVLSFVPPFIPYVMMVRIPSGEVPIWQIPVSLLVGACSVYASVWIASRIFRIGVMMRGKAPGIMQLLQWIRRID